MRFDSHFSLMFFLLVPIAESDSFFAIFGSSDVNSSLIPTLSLTMIGESRFTVYDPIIVISTRVVCFFFPLFLFLVLTYNVFEVLNCPNYMQGDIIYCLAVVKSSEMNIIGRKSLSFLQLI